MTVWQIIKAITLVRRGMGTPYLIFGEYQEIAKIVRLCRKKKI